MYYVINVAESNRFERNTFWHWDTDTMQIISSRSAYYFGKKYFNNDT